jgi:hypothetical protein
MPTFGDKLYNKQDRLKLVLFDTPSSHWYAETLVGSLLFWYTIYCWLSASEA